MKRLLISIIVAALLALATVAPAFADAPGGHDRATICGHAQAHARFALIIPHCGAS